MAVMMITRTANQKLLALCCECGMVRTVTEWDSFGEAESRDVPASRNPFGRCFLWRKCRRCGTDTKHAYLRQDENRDELELVMIAVDVERAAEQILAEMQVPMAVDGLRDRGVRVDWYSGALALDPEAAVGTLTWYLESNAFVVELDESADVLRLLWALRRAGKIVDNSRVWPLWDVEPAGFWAQPTARVELCGAGWVR